jgi:hypothetical protein
MGGFDFFQTQLAAYSSGVTVRGESLAAFDGGAAGNYAFQVRARNGFGTSGMSSTALIFWPGMIAAGPPSEPANVYCESHWEEYRVYFERPQAATSYVLDWGSGSRDLSAVSYINGYCFVIPKGVIGTGSYSSTLTARNEYGDSTQASFTIAHVASPALNLLTPTYDAAGIYLHYSPQSYYPVGTQFKVLYGTSSPPGTSLSPLATLTGGQNRLVVPRTSFPSGSTYYFLVQAVGEFETTGVDSNTVSINIP